MRGVFAIVLLASVGYTSAYRFLVTAGKFDETISDDTELINIPSDYSTAVQCPNATAPLRGFPSLLLSVPITATNGNPVICAGQIFNNGSDGYINDCNEYDPVADSWTQNLNMAEARKGASVDQLDDGSYWAVGGVTFLPNGKKVNLLSTEIYKDGAWSAGPDLERDARTGCTVNIPNYNLTLVIKNNASLYDWNTQSWTFLNDSNVMKFAGRGYGCGFVTNGTDSYVMVAGGNDGKDRSQILPLGAFLASGNTDDVGDWTDGPMLPAQMIDSATIRMADESFIMFGTKINTGKFKGHIVRFDPVAYNFVSLGSGANALAVARSEAVVFKLDDREVC